MKQYIVAGQVLQMERNVFEAISGFDCFLSEEKREKALLEIYSERLLPGEPLPDWAAVPGFSSILDECPFDFYVEEDSYFLRMRQPESFLVEVRKKATGFYAKMYATKAPDPYPFRFALWIAFGIAALSQKTVSIHASTIIHNGKSVLFLGESGTGKSTHTRSWLKHIPNTELLNDDSPFVRVESTGDIQVYGSPWSGKTPCYKNIQTPIAAFVRLSQAPQNRIRRLKGAEALGALLPSCPLVFAYDKQLSESIYTILSCVLQQLPVYHLECLPDADAARLVLTTLQQDGYF